MRKLVTAAVITAGVFLAGISCSTLGWEVPNLAQAGVIETFTCDQTEQAIDTVSMAAEQQDPEALTALGITSTNKADLTKKLNAQKAKACGETPVAAPIKGTGTPAPWPCPGIHVQYFDPNERGNLSSFRIEDTDELLALAGRDARALGAYATHPDLQFLQNPDPSPLLTPDNTCLSQEGQNVWNQMKGALTAGGVKKEHTEAPATWHNTAMVGGQFVVDPQPGIGGDRSALSYTLRNGGKFVVMKRCANPVLPSPGDLPQGPTDHQRPGTPPAVPPREREECVSCEHSPPGECESGCIPDDTKKSNEAPGQGGVGDGGASQYGGTGSDRHQTQGSVSPPAAGDPPAHRPTPAQPAPAPVPGGTPAPQPTQPPATGAPPPSEAPDTCVNPPGMDVCG